MDKPKADQYLGYEATISKFRINDLVVTKDQGFFIVKQFFVYSDANGKHYIKYQLQKTHTEHGKPIKNSATYKSYLENEMMPAKFYLREIVQAYNKLHAEYYGNSEYRKEE